MAEFLFYDYETFGLDPRKDRIAQFAAIRTDENFTVIDEPINIYCKQYDDYLASPEAILITGITPHYCNEHGLAEREFAMRIYHEFMKPNTCVLGFNSVRFDDEMTRYLFYRNFFDPYAYTWQNGNSRWDVLDLIRGVYALRPAGISWPTIDGKVSLKLEELSRANGLEHECAHDALSDVYATIAVLKLIKEKQPRFFEYFFKHRTARALLPMIEQHLCRPLVHISGMFGEANGYLSLVVPIAMHPWNHNAVITIDLRGDLDELLHYSADEIKTSLYTATADLAKGRSRVPLKLIHLNKCPIIAPFNTLQDVEHLYGLNVESALGKVESIQLHQAEIEKKVSEVFKIQTAPSHNARPILYRVESMLYDGFFDNNDKRRMEQIPYLSEENLQVSVQEFNDARVEPLLFLYRAKNYPQSLNEEEKRQWREYCAIKYEENIAALQTMYLEKIEEYKNDQEKSKLLADCYSLYFSE